MPIMGFIVGKPVSWIFLAPSVTPKKQSIGSNNPAMRLYKFDTDTGQVSRHFTNKQMYTANATQRQQTFMRWFGCSLLFFFVPFFVLFWKIISLEQVSMYGDIAIDAKRYFFFLFRNSSFIFQFSPHLRPLFIEPATVYARRRRRYAMHIYFFFPFFCISTAISILVTT